MMLDKDASITILQAPAEAEAQLCGMLRFKEIDKVVLPSRDSDITIYDSGTSGSFIFHPIISGTTTSRGSKKKHPKPELKGVEIRVQLISQAFSQATMPIRVVIASMMGHDYDSCRGLHGWGPEKSFGCIQRFKSIQGEDDMDTATKCLQLVVGSAEVDILHRLLAVVVGFLIHPIFVAGKCKTYLTNTSNICMWTTIHTPQFFRFIQQLETSWTPPDWKEYNRVNCTGCSVEDLTLCHAEEIQRLCLKIMVAEDCPTISAQIISAYIGQSSESDPLKFFLEGVHRMHDSAHLANTLKGQHEIASEKPILWLQMEIVQSQNRGTLKPMFKFSLSPNLDSVAEILEGSCNCIRGHKGAMCRHRAALLAFLYTCTILELAGSPVRRAAYWKRRSAIATSIADSGGNTAVRFVDVLTKHDIPRELRQELSAVKPGADRAKKHKVYHIQRPGHDHEHTKKRLKAIFDENYRHNVLGNAKVMAISNSYGIPSRLM
eukprot:m.47047 g.47047  ORF g.47047 m.47047 type:complete len:490 (+) comp15195_c0_seq2:482-1951(+)